ncbi:fimbria/pilus outer membrane usher protein [Pseudomonas sp. TTU2014-080ASC]|uniref:fimbria/pilus outer membrane usher protein n=1 Tax=Pseudomonas sp. TTU2014-080ASC TaxID=1729724 RepID=UPI000A828CFE
MIRRGCFFLCVLGLATSSVEALEFNSEFLNIDSDTGVSLEKFARGQYVVPGVYLLDIVVNQRSYGSESIEFITSGEGVETYPCLRSDLIKKFGLKPSVLQSLPYHAGTECVSLDAIDNSKVNYQAGLARLSISLPQVSFEYDDPSYMPPAAWSDGINGAILDYRVIANHRHATGGGSNGESNSLQSYGTAGLNIDAWRIRADYQAQKESGSYSSTFNDKTLQFNRFYAYRALPSIRSKFSVGEDYLNSDIFDTFALKGATLSSDERMLPLRLRGYAPLISGLAQTNATVTVSQEGRVLYSTTVTPGQFSIQDLDSSVQGLLDVTVKEEDGTEQNFTVATATVPFLAREDELRYKISAGRPRLTGGGIEPNFISSELAYGLPMEVTLYGGVLAADDYLSSAFGIGKDLGSLGALSVDVTNARAKLYWSDEVTEGNSYRINYSKRFDSIGTDLRFLGYRFSEKSFTNFSQFVGAPNSYSMNSGKQRYSITLAKNFPWMSASFSYDHSTYWDAPTNNRFGLTLARRFSIAGLHNLNVHLSAYQTRNTLNDDTQIYLGLSLPLGNGAVVSSTLQHTGSGDPGATMGYSYDDGQGINYQVYGAVGEQRSASANVSKRTASYRANASATTDGSTYRSVTASVNSSLVLTSHGLVSHANGSNGDTRLLASTDGVEGVAFAGLARTNSKGHVVVDGVPSFQAYEARVNVNELPLDVEVANPIQRMTLTEGAIGHVNFAAGRGYNAFIEVTQDGGDFVPFGASVQDTATNREVGIVGEQGVTYLLGVKAGADLIVRWGDGQSCKLAELPEGGIVTNVAKPVRCQ